MADEWDSSTANASAPSKGFGAPKGFGRGVLRQSNGESKVGSGWGSGDSGNSSGGFGKMNSNADASESNGGGGGGFGGSRGGFGAKKGFGSSGQSNGFENSSNGASESGGSSKGFGGFGSRTETNGESAGGGGFGSKNGFGGGGGGFGSDRPPRGGGFGGGDSKPRTGFGRGRGSKVSGGSGGGKGCFKCGEEGHFSRECPSSGGGGGGGSRACFKCGEEGHMSRECPSGGGGEGGGSRACFKCGEEGHMSRECPSGGGGGGGGSRACFKCGEEGHMSRECPKGGGGGGGKGCFKCGEEGHMSRECPSGGGGGGGNRGCFKCGEEGHISRDCTNPAKEGGLTLDNDRPPPYIPPAPSEDEEEIFKTITKGINFDNYDKIRVEVTGDNQPAAIQSFDDGGLYAAFLANVKKAKYEKPTPVQKYSVPIIMAGRDLMACAQTGSGKTAAFLLPTLTGMMNNGLTGSQFSEVQEPQALVIAPTRELAIQIFMECRKFAHGTMLRPVVAYGGTSVGYQLREVEKGTHILVGTPGRLLDILGKGKVSLAKLKYLILDEADRMLDMGFMPDVRRVCEDFGMPGKTERQTLMFSATFPTEIQKLAGEFLNNYIFLSVGVVGGANTDVSQHVFEIERLNKRDYLIDILKESGTEKTLVFVEQKRNADFLASMLSQSGFPTTSIHGDRLQREREEALRDFKIGRAPILIATSVAARGLDIPEVKHVINYDLPQSIDEYVHRIGRTGRCGNLGKATSFYSHDTDSGVAKALRRILSDASQVVPEWLEEYANSSLSTAGYVPSGGKFGGRDIRKGVQKRQEESETGGGGGYGGGGSGYGGGGSGYGGGGSGFGGGGGGDDEESWD